MSDKKFLTCKDLESSLYIAPNEVRACCQRFFYEGKMRGDANLLEIQDGKTPTAKDIKEARQKLFEQIQIKKSNSCTGCPFLYEVKEKPKLDSKINHLSIEHHSVCNLRCTYCSEIYYGGKRSKYNVVEFIKYLNDSESLKHCKQVVWGGGEPTLDKSFEQIVKEIDKYANPEIYHRVFTNSVRYHQSIVDFLKKGLIKIVTSIDAGTRETFKSVRGRDKFQNVFENLKKYSSIDPNKVTIKYILTNGNDTESEIENFVENCIKNNLINCAYQISMNYKYSDLNLDMLKKISYLMGLLKNNNINKIFCDDHIALRFKKISTEEKTNLIKFLKLKNIDNVIINSLKIKKLNIYGIGDIATNFLNKSTEIKQFDEINLYDSDPKKIGSKIMHLTINDPKKIDKNSHKIFISTAQSYDDIYQNLINMKIAPSRIVSGLLI